MRAAAAEDIGLREEVEEVLDIGISFAIWLPGLATFGSLCAAQRDVVRVDGRSFLKNALMVLGRSGEHAKTDF
ncbi:MAG: hypothetical protein KDE68_00455 [Rhodocyclaceae bacterium]|nr:hypothetical protein [Rhodocyclaceae bacterium]